jgi:eukaryotic-like serine/threonine-protein kinase
VRAQYFLEGLLELSTEKSAAARRASLRESIVLLVRAVGSRGPGPLEGLDPAALVPSVRLALSDGLFDDLGWLAPESAAVALYEIARALPPGPEKHEVGRRVAVYTYEGTAYTFAAVATRMALGSGKGLAGAPIRARVALALELPSGMSERVDTMALALAARRELAREWIVKLSRGSLGARRLSSRLIERAASEAARLAAQGDVDAARCFRAEGLARAYADLLSDREPLVWRHAAIARGLLTSARPELWTEIDDNLSPELSPTEWRRAGASLATALVSDPSRGMRRVREVLRGDVVRRDTGVAGCMLWGLAHAAKFEPEAAQRLAAEIVLLEGSAVGEAFEEALREEPSWAETFAHKLLKRDVALGLHLFKKRLDDGHAALAAELLFDLGPGVSKVVPLRVLVRRALAAFATEGARQAQDLAQHALDAAREQVSSLERHGAPTTSDARRRLFATLRDLELSLVEAASLSNLLALDRKNPETRVVAPAVEELHQRLSSLLLGWQAGRGADSEKGAGPNVELRELRTLIHLLDADADASDADQGPRMAALKQRWLHAAQTLGARLERGAPHALRRSLLAGLAQALDGLVRSGMCDAADVLLWVAWHVTEVGDVETLSEATHDPDLVSLLARYAALMRALSSEQEDVGKKLGAFAFFGQALSGESSGREEALREVTQRLGRTLAAIHDAKGISDLARGDAAATSPMGQLDAATTVLAQLVTAARRRLEDSMDDVSPRSVAAVASSIELATDRAAAGDNTEWAATLGLFVRALWGAVPGPIVSLIKDVLRTIVELPQRSRSAAAKVETAEAPLPDWIPARRTIGGFYIVRQVGAGGLGSVFVAKRIEERHDETAELFALKVPVYDPRAARQLSEAEFLKMFQSEASALLTLPAHPNLAGFVTFDLGAKPKPILVMELVDGVGLDRLLDTRQLTCQGAGLLLDGVLAGLEGMHSVGVGHLDVKPSNVLVRGGEQPVLVDFGLAGRHIRPGCGSGAYGAPEVWGLDTPEPPSPMAADVYAIACLAFELFSGRPLFEQSDATSLVAAHVEHDGWPMPLRPWYQKPQTTALAQLLARALRRDGRLRCSVGVLRAEFGRLSPSLSAMPWPL